MPPVVASKPLKSTTPDSDRRGEVKCDVEPGRRDARDLGNVAAMKAHLLVFHESGELAIHRAGLAKVIDQHQRVTFVREAASEVAADEPPRPRDQDPHRRRQVMHADRRVKKILHSDRTRS